MILIFFMFPAAVVGSLLAFGIWAARLGWGDFRTRASMVALLCLLVSYGVGIGLICYDPYFIDNGGETFIEWRFRWAWAMMLAGICQIIIVPVGLAAYGYWHYRKRVVAKQ